MNRDNSDNKGEDRQEDRYDLQAMLEEIESEKKIPDKKIAGQAEISEFFKKNRKTKQAQKHD